MITCRFSVDEKIKNVKLLFGGLEKQNQMAQQVRRVFLMKFNDSSYSLLIFNYSTVTDFDDSQTL